MKPLLAHVYEPKRWAGPCYVQPKLNGIRGLSAGGHFQSRDEIPWTAGILDHLTEPLRDIFPADLVLDGELYVHGWTLMRINGAIAVNRQSTRDDTREVEYHIFDCARQGTFAERNRQLQSFLPALDGTNIKLVPTQRVNTETEADVLYSYWVTAGYEGMMYRLGDCPYTYPKQPGGRKFLSDKNNRCWHLLKRKSWLDEDFDIIGTDEGEGKQAGMVGALVLRTSAGVVFKSGTGLTDTEATYLFHNPPVGRKAKIRFLCYSPDGKPMNSSIQAVL